MNKQIRQSSTYVKEVRSIINKIRMRIGLKTLALIIILLQITLVLLILNPIRLYQEYTNQQILAEVANLTELNQNEQPLIAQISDANSLRNENAIQAEVYKNAKNGDYAIGYSDKLIIYRKDEKRIIYKGDTPNKALINVQEEVLNAITEQAKTLNLISSDSTELPQVTTIQDVEPLKMQNPEFYKNAKDNDLIAVFANSQVILIYNMNNNSVVNKGKFFTSITQL